MNPLMDPASQNVTVHAREAEEHSDKRARQGAFLAAYETLGRVMPSAEAAGVDRRQHYRWLKEPWYAEAFKESDEIATQMLEDEAVRRARGIDGAQPSDRLLIKLLESKRPEVYNHPSKHEHSGTGNRPIEMNVSASELLLSRIAALASGVRAPAGDPGGSR